MFGVNTKAQILLYYVANTLLHICNHHKKTTLDISRGISAICFLAKRNFRKLKSLWILNDALSFSNQ